MIALIYYFSIVEISSYSDWYGSESVNQNENGSSQNLVCVEEKNRNFENINIFYLIFSSYIQILGQYSPICNLLLLFHCLKILGSCNLKEKFY